MVRFAKVYAERSGALTKVNLSRVSYVLVTILIFVCSIVFACVCLAKQYSKPTISLSRFLFILVSYIVFFGN